MTLDRTKPPPFFRRVDHKGDYCILDNEQSSIYDVANIDGEGSSAWVTYDQAWEWYDRITLPARVALLREIAEQIEIVRRGRTDDGFAADTVAKLRGWADALEAGSALLGSGERPK